MGKLGTVYTEDEIKAGLMAVIAWNGNIPAAVRDLNERNIPVRDTTLRRWVNHEHSVEYHRLRDEHAPDLEARLAHEFRDVAARAVEVQSLALLRARERLENNQDADPAKTAAFAARAGQTAVDKLMTLTNRPERITEQRDIKEVLRSLAGKGVLKVLPSTDSTASEDDPPELTA